MEITKQLEISDEHLYSLEMHSFINIINLMYNHLFLLQEESESPDMFNASMEMVYNLAYGVKSKDRKMFNPGNLRTYKETVNSLFEELEKKDKSLKKDVDFQEMRSFFGEIIQVMEVRIDDLLMRWANPMKWDVYWTDDFKNQFLNYFYALEKNSKGNYRIIYNIAENEVKNFRVTFDVKSSIVHSITMPVLFKDVIRDLVTNSRKYTYPGGRIDIRMEMDNNLLRFTVTDNGIGIPADEIEEVVQYKYRASNVLKHKEILGNGFGLTKSYYNTKLFGGRFFIESELGKGTKVTIELPIPDTEYMNANFGA